MNQITKRTILMVFIGVVFLLMVNSVSFAYVMGNDGPRGYIPPTGMSNSNIEANVIEGAGYFLNSNADFFMFLNKIEMSGLNGVDYNELRAILNRAIENMEKAKSVYTSLVQTASVTPYNPSFIDGLKAFDYVGLQKNFGLNGIIFQEVVTYLYKGDITGIFARILDRTGIILDSLYTVKKYIDADTFPVIANLWRINQSYFETVLFGQYAAEVFAKIN